MNPSANASKPANEASPPRPHQSDVIYVLRTAQQHHVMLGMIADQKANIILGAFLIFITVSQSLAEKQAQLPMPLLILSGFFTLAALFALLVIAPRFRNPKPAGGAARNLLFFGSFTQMSQDDFIEQLRAGLETNAQARELIMKDIYQIGQVLQKKYTNLRLSYLSLGAGIALAAMDYLLMLISA